MDVVESSLPARTGVTCVFLDGPRAGEQIDMPGPSLQVLSARAPAAALMRTDLYDMPLAYDVYDLVAFGPVDGSAVAFYIYQGARL